MAELREGPQPTIVEHLVLERAGVGVPVTHARPEGVPVAGLVLHPDIMGNRDLFDDMARRLASHGFAVACVEPFARVAQAERDATEAMGRMEWIARLDDATQLGDLEAAASHLVVHDDVTTVGLLGFCMGGCYVFKSAHSDWFDRAVAFYGMPVLPSAWRGPAVAEPLATVADACPTLAIFGSADTFTPPADIDALRDAWADRSDCEIVVIEGAEHGFVHAPERPAHRPDDAAQLWERALAWLAG
jgi:carboxymethylenebutenolidase